MSSIPWLGRRPRGVDNERPDAVEDEGVPRAPRYLAPSRGYLPSGEEAGGDTALGKQNPRE